MDDTLPSPLADASASAPQRKRPRPGERRLQILQVLAQMLQDPGGERVTTAGLAARLGVSEAALYRHFASKAQMYEGLLDFIESSLLTLVNHISISVQGPGAGMLRCRAMVTVVLQFAQKNPGMARVMVGDALVLEHPRLQLRMNQLFEKLEAALRQALRDDATTDGLAVGMDGVAAASALVAYMTGRLHRFVRSDFSKSPLEKLEPQLDWLLG